MKIVVADPIYLPEEYRKKLEVIGQLRIFDTMPSSLDEFIERIKDADIILIGRYGFSNEAFLHAKNLKMISVWQTGYDHIDLDSATENKVIVSNVSGYAFDSVAEMVFAFALNLFRRVHIADSKIRKGMFDWRDYVGNQLMGKTIGVIGTGNIGIRVIQIAHGFNMNVISTTAHPNPQKELRLGVKLVDLDTLLSESDIVTLHVPLTPDTEKMIGEAELAKMKSSSILINTSRGKVVDEAALIKTLQERKIRGSGLDVFENEPLPEDSALMELDNVVLTPHIAFLSEESLEECTYICIENVEKFVEGEPQNIVNPEVLGK
ncbi:2-hydroxyacid dehydrogenase [Methanohalophilus mahii]|uniref:D-isomer specific 2-hydroxyacid dehydrogenase NAD-binding protein n=1 Tax=Methanohalophilus mahii (strain ATCC 35705 / DSM 5219 / SLP) TaxID=547558 RepID=D5E6L8_METMS|nr:2-hydroxyacid dehydrogenase [Methanohalophilus mahii]ADE36806.1 D-isomer specific 2-hydroxyacid dehydrogenase NAD-binding protein [Methanohalophilus mahii DSM 5219]